jgi:hypothetical protein
MKQAALAVVLLIVCFFLLTNCEGSRERVYDCGMAEWHPDIPKEVKEACRKLRSTTNYI